MPFFIMVLNFYTTLSPDNMLSKVLDNLVTVNAKLNGDFDVLSPTFRLTESVSDVQESNYLVVPEWNRCYFIRGFNMTRQGVLDVYCKEDVLSTYATEIRQCMCLVHFGQNAPAYLEGLNTGFDARRRFVRRYDFDNPFTDGSFVLVGIKGERRSSS